MAETESVDPVKVVTKRLLQKKKVKPPIDEKKRLSSGSSLINLAWTGNINYGIDPGCYYLLVGDSKACKTFLVLTILAEASINPAYDKYRLIYDAPELGARMDIAKFFGPRLKQRMECLRSKTVEDLYYSLDDCFDDGRPFIYVEDSETALSSKAERKKFKEHKAASRKKGAKEPAGSYGDGKPKYHSGNLRDVTNRLADNGSILLFVSQTRQNIDMFSFETKTRSGGDALRFYATGEAWFSVAKGINKTVNGIPRKIGTEIAVQVKKNRDTGYEPKVIVHHYPSVGIDDIGSMVQYLVDEKHWKKTSSESSDGKGEKSKITVPEWDFSGSREQLVQYILKNGKERDLKAEVSEVWKEVMAKCCVERVSRYAMTAPTAAPTAATKKE